jgi:hypothetical protein
MELLQEGANDFARKAQHNLYAGIFCFLAINGIAICSFADFWSAIINIKKNISIVVAMVGSSDIYVNAFGFYKKMDLSLQNFF